jgi:hypothetical protein
MRYKGKRKIFERQIREVLTTVEIARETRSILELAIS